MKSGEGRQLSVLIKKKSAELGFDLCGIARSEVLSEDGTVFKKWCETGMNAGMSYLQKNIEKRINPGLVLEEARSLVVAGISYYSEIKQKDPGAPLLSRYAYGRNYHDVISSKLDQLLVYIRTLYPSCRGKVFCDSGPVLEKAWARMAGLGWQGRNSVIINKNIGSFFFIGALILDIESEYDSPFDQNYCDDCRICIDNCPTGAINDNNTIDARKCIAYLTIENKGPIPEDIIPRLGGRVYGCDACQQSCPWNKKPQCRPHPEFQLNEEIAEMSREEWLSLTEEKYLKLFRSTAVERVKYNDLMRNVKAAVKSMNYPGER